MHRLSQSTQWFNINMCIYLTPNFT
jgi:hypothetical protein